jgi:hypothetical protein
MNCLYITLFFNIFAGIVQTLNKPWNRLLYPRVIEFCRLKKVVRDQRWPTAPLFIVNISPSFAQFTAPLRHILPIHNVTTNSNNLFVIFRWTFTFLRWEIVWRNAPRIWRDFGSALPFQTRLTQTKPVLPLSNEHGSQVKDQGRQQICHNKHKIFPIGLHVMYFYFPDTPRTCIICLVPLFDYVFSEVSI